jgi:hypothetical protein
MLLRGLLIAITTALCIGLLVGQQKGDSSGQQELLLINPDFIQMSLVAIASKRASIANPHVEIPERFKAGGKVNFDLTMANTSLVAVRILVWDTYVQNRPELYRESQLLIYRDEIEKLLPETEKQTDFMRMDSVLLEPGRSKSIEVINLADWYDSLKPGHYQLKVKHRFQQGGKWIESASVTFEVDPK